MAFTIMEQMAKPGDLIYYESDFQYIVETHLNHLKTENSTIEEIPMDLYYQYEGDFYGYLIHVKGVRPEYLWIYLRVNGMTNPNQFGKDQRNPLARSFKNRLIIPSGNLISGIAQFYTTRKFK